MSDTNEMFAESLRVVQSLYDDLPLTDQDRACVVEMATDLQLHAIRLKLERERRGGKLSPLVEAAAMAMALCGDRRQLSRELQ